ncbi:MAG: GNAT family N-acetyltransferase, partial [Candidatus Delongbacteria bacterium]|nr:GNAT family N-acetyltransferase [Candidatus Delongbacteria bacterium]MCG2760382.1 GNAT family N-acetyltransferase [Candidatus Delongbacteria bacterium]
MNITFRPAEVEDLQFLDTVEKLSFPPNRQNNSKSLRLSVISTFQEVWVAESKEKNKIVQIADAVLYPHRKTLRVYSIAVMPEYRNKGVGHKFIEKIKERAKSKGCLSISLEADADNQALVKWYIDHGFVIKEELKDYYGQNEDAVRMSIGLEKGGAYIQNEGHGSGMRNFIVVDNPAKWSLDIDTAEVISAKDYITEPRFNNINNARIFNICNSYRYQSLGYYVSLLASARDHRAMPNVTTIRDFTDVSIIRNIALDIDGLIQESLKNIKDTYFSLTICFGHTIEKGFIKLAKEIYQLFESPLLKVSFAKSKDWSVRKIVPLSLDSLKSFDQTSVEKFAKEYFSQKRFNKQRMKNYPYDLAILTDPNEKYPPSDKKALAEFKKAAEEVGFYTEFITKKDYDRLPEFDALFIRETTNVNDHTYLFSRRAYSEGLVVIDDPWSILRCSNKMFLYERMNRGRVLTPKTWMLTKGIALSKLMHNIVFPLVLKQPDGSFSKGMYKVNDLDEMKEKLDLMYKTSDLIIAQEFLKSDFDWRIGVLDGSPLFASKYYMAKGHWQIYNWANEGFEELHTGDFETLPINQVPSNLISAAVKACSLIGDGLYGVDLKEVNGKVYLIEINDNPN